MGRHIEVQFGVDAKTHCAPEAKFVALGTFTEVDTVSP